MPVKQERQPTIPSPYLTIAEGARFLRFDVTAPSDPEGAFRRWLRRQAVPLRKRGRTILIERRHLEAFLEQEP
jgi:hypothetical protein